MASFKIVIAVLSLHSIIYFSCAAENLTFTQDVRLNHTVYPINLKGKTLFSYDKNDNTVITSTESGHEDCEIPGKIPAMRWTLGNGKIIAITHMFTNFTILDYKNCTSYSSNFINATKPYKYVPKQVKYVIPYYDTFDVFDYYLTECTPCRYNEKGEQIQLNKELDEKKQFQYAGYFIGPITNSSDGNVEGYFFFFSPGHLTNSTSFLQILDRNFNVVKERSIEGQIKDSSMQYGRATVCYSSDKHQLDCQLFDSNLNIIATAKMDPSATWDIIYVKISNLKTGGAMVAMECVGVYLGPIRTQEVVIQQIQADGTVEPRIAIGDFDVDYRDRHLFTSWFTLKNGDHCLLTAVKDKNSEGYSLIKCIKPKTPKKDLYCRIIM